MSLDDEESAATDKVLALIRKQIDNLRLIYPPDGHALVTSELNETIIWMGVGSVVLLSLAHAARSRSESSVADLEKLRAFVDDDHPPHSATQQGNEALPPGEVSAVSAEAVLLARARDLLRPVQEVHLVDRAVVLRVWSDFRRVFEAAAKSKDFAGLSEAFAVLLRAGIEKASGVELLGLLYDLVSAIRKRQKDAEAAASLFTYLDALSYVYARTSMLAQCATIRLTSRARGRTDDEVLKLAQDEVIAHYAQLLQESTLSPPAS
jgi:hypothetical protein